MQDAREISDRPYLNTRKLSDDCGRIIQKHFRELHARDWPHSRAILSQSSDERFCIHFPDSKGSKVCGTVSEVAGELLSHFDGLPELRILLWGNLPEKAFIEVVQALESRNLRLLCRHEQHVVVNLVRGAEQQIKKAA